MHRYFCFIFFIFLSLPSEVFAKGAQVAIVIDDIGYRTTDAQTLTLPGNITLSILPHTPFGKRIALKAYAQQKDVILHIPMEAENGKKLGPGGLTTGMDETEIHQSLQAAFKEIPFALGINNHMGSKLTKLYQPMAWTMAYLKEYNLLFLDSKTSIDSKAEQAALDVGVPVRKRHVFLDNQLDQSYIAQQFSELIAQANANKTAIAIAHPHPETIRALKNLLPLLTEHNIELVPLSLLYRDQNTVGRTLEIAE